MINYPLNDWDFALLKEYPYTSVISLASLDRAGIKPTADLLADACNWCYTNLESESYSWKGIRFFFKHSKYCLLFTLKYA